jgi:uncharacterized protein YcnI
VRASLWRRAGRRLVAVLVMTATALVVTALPASAHVTVKPDAAPKGSFSVLSFSVPNERSDASTVTMEVTFPVDHPIPFVSVQPVPGWTWTAEKATLAKPVKAEGSQITEAVSKITWTGGEIKPGEFQLFTVSAGLLPTNTKSIEFKALQTYSNGEVVRWIESTPKGAPEPEFPAPTLKLKGKSQEH